jgi:hypothetical protein
VDPKAGVDDMEKLKILDYRDSNSYPSVVQPVASRYTDYATEMVYHGLGRQHVWESTEVRTISVGILD